MSAHSPERPVFEPFCGLPSIPALEMLRQRRQWVNWDYVLKPGGTKWTKPPLNPATGRGASHSDPTTWSSYDAAAQRAMREGLPGVGFVLADDDGIGGFDLDDCRDPETETLKPWAAEILALVETYAEVSPSGRGVRIFCQGKPEKATKCDPAGVELYAKNRFLTVTGRHLSGTPTEIRPAPRTLAALLERVEVINRQIDGEKAKIRGAAHATLTKPSANGKGKLWETLHPRSPFFKNVNDRAFANLTRWVPDLFGAAAESTSLGYRVSSAALGRQLEEDLSITTNGAKDFGLHDQGDARGGSRTAIDLVMEHGGAPDPVQASRWLCDRLGIDPVSLGWNEPKPVGGKPVQLADDGFGSKADGARTYAAERPGEKDEPRLISDRGVLVPALRDRLEIALQPDPAPSFPVDALPTLMADMVQAIADIVQAPETLCAHAVLSSAVLVTQGLANIKLPNSPRSMPLRLFLLVVAASGERKTSCDSIALKAVGRLEARLSETYAEDMRIYRADKAAWEGDVSKVKNDKNIDANERKRRIRALREPEEPTAPIIRATEPNLEGLLNLLVKGRPSLGVFTAEGGSFLGGHGMSDDAKTRTLTGLSMLYDDGSAQRVRAREITIITGRRVSISLAAQEKVAAALLGDELAQDQGFLGRFLVCYPDSRIGTREVKATPIGTDPRVEAFTDRTDRLLHLQDSIKAPLDLPKLTIDDIAREVFRVFSQAIEDNLGKGKLWHPIRAAAQRMAENVGRIAGVLHLFAHGDTNQLVSGDTMAAACEIGAFYLKESLRISGGVMVDAETQAAHDLAAWIEGRPGNLIAPSIIQQFAPNSLRMSAATTRERIRLLCAAGRLEAIGEGNIDGKHYREVYRINRQGVH